MNLPAFVAIPMGGLLTVAGGWFVFELCVDWFFGGTRVASDDKEG